MLGNIPDWAKFLFDGVGGAALIGLIRYGFHRWRSAKHPEAPAPTIATSTVVEDVESKEKSVAFGSGASIHGSPIVYGSHNVFNFPHHSGVAKPEEAEKKPEEAPVWLVILGILVVLTVVAGVIYFSTPDSTPTPKSASPTPAQQSTDAAGTPASPTRSTYSAGVQYGQNIESGAGTGYQFTACTKEGISCLGENAISDKTISIPLQKGTDWSRIAVLITFTEPGNMAQIVVSTTSDAVGLNYADHRDGMFHKQVEFQSEYPEAISKTERPLWYPVDILFRNPVEKFPLTITVKEDDQPAHSVTTYLKVLGLSAPSAQKANPNPTTQRATPTATTAPESSSELVAKPTERKITIADRVTVIIAHQLSLSAGKLKPEDDFEMDLGASPTEVTLIMYDLQTEYEILIPKSDAMKIKTVGEAIEYIEQREK